jgi:hypothetical protein
MKNEEGVKVAKSKTNTSGTCPVVYDGSKSQMPYGGLGVFYKGVPRDVPLELIPLFEAADNFTVLSDTPPEVIKEAPVVEEITKDGED